MHTGFDEIARIQSYLRENARSQYDAVALAPFTLFIKPGDDTVYFNYAIPDQPTSGDLRAVLAELSAEFRRRQRVPRFEFFEAFAPELPAALTASGFREEARQWSMLCAPAGLREAPPVDGLEEIAIHAGSADADIAGFILAQRQGFNPAYSGPPTAADVKNQRDSFVTGGWRGFLGRVDGEAAGVSVYGRPIDGVSEIAGVATRGAFRRRGIASRLTYLAVAEAFARGVTTACLTAEDETAGRVYERIGFQPFSTMLAFIDGQPHQEPHGP